MPVDAHVDLLALAGDPGLAHAAVVAVDGWQLFVAEPVAQLRTVEQLSRFAEHIGWRDPPHHGPPRPPLAVGFVSDDVTPALLGLPADPRPPVAHLPAVWFGVYEWALAVAPGGRTYRLGDVPARLLSPGPGDLRPAAATDPAPTARAGLDRRAHAERVAQILDWIAAGDLYQANLTFQIAVDWDGSAAALARQLSGATPGAAHAALLHPGSGQAVVSVSPETFLRTRGDRVESRPIKGTRRRSADPVTDRRNARALSASAKDAAEHVMIVDLVRNDLGRVCRPGSITVPTLAGLESHPTVWHLSSSIRGAMTPTTSLGDLLAATFPPGSVTGAPKRMAVSKTALLEPVRRGVYCGAVGVVARGGATLSVAIRTAVVEDGLASYGAGGGIVADSDASAEYDEALDKAAAFLRATGATLAG